MTDTIIVALITGGLSLVGVVISNLIINRKTTALIEYKLQELRGDVTTLSRRVDEHNHLVERMAAVESSTKSAHHRLDTLEQNIRHD